MQHITGNSFFFHSQSSIGGYKRGDQLLLFDTGNDDSSVKKAIRAFDNIKVIAVFNTHSHADHCGGNAYLSKHFAMPIYAPYLETSFIENPILEPTYLFSASPPVSLQNKFLMAKPSTVPYVISDESPISISFDDAQIDIQPVALRGHSPNQFGYITPDSVAYLGDALISSEMIEKHPLIFTFDVKEHIESLHRLKMVKAEGYVIAHGGYFTDITDIIHSNLEALDKTQNLILSTIGNGKSTFDELHRKIAYTYQLTENIGQYWLNRSVIHAHVKYLLEIEMINFDIDHGVICFSK
ncbi:MBL fold metallo-hydrolase [Fusibacter bizertensis]